MAPTVVLLFLSKEDRLGPGPALVLALSFPLGHAVWSRVRGDAVSPLSVLAVVSVVLTGSIGLLQLDARWFAAKEALLPLVMAAVTWGSRYTSWPVVETLMFRILDRDRVTTSLREKGADDALSTQMGRVERWFLVSFLYSSVGSLALALWVVSAPAGTPEFNEQLGRFTFLSFPAIALPTTLLMGYALNGMLNALEAATGLEIDDLLRPGLSRRSS